MIKKNRYSKVVELVNGLDCSLDYEFSCKLARGQLGTERFLVGIDLHHCQLQRVLTLVRDLGMPGIFFDALQQGLPQANKVGIGVEQGPKGNIVKVYLEYWERLVEGVRSGRYPKGKPVLMYQGFKWDADAPERTALHQYECLPLLSVHEVMRRVSKLLGGPTGGPVRDAVDGLIRKAGGTLHRDSFVYTEVDDPQSRRKSFDVNLYKSGLCIGDIADHLRLIGDAMEIPTSDIGTLIAARRGARLGHLSGGTSGDGTGFVTLYFEAS